MLPPASQSCLPRERAKKPSIHFWWQGPPTLSAWPSLQAQSGLLPTSHTLQQGLPGGTQPQATSLGLWLDLVLVRPDGGS